jgi:predicted dehydrogenase
MKSKMRIGLAGCGNISDIYIENSRRFDNYEVVACADALPERAREKAAKFGIARACGLEELLGDRSIGLLLNLTNPQSHASVDLAALSAGKHVYSEKPLAIDRDEGARLIQAASSKGLRLGCAPDTFLGGRLQTMRELIDTGAIGTVVGGFASMACHGHESWHPGPEFYYKKGAGPIFDMGPYYLTALASILGPVRRLSGAVATSFPSRRISSQPLAGRDIEVEVPTHVSGNLEFAAGAVVTTLVTFDVWDSHLPRLELYGSEGSLAICDADPLAGPNIFGGDLFLRRAKDADWNGFPSELPRRGERSPWERIVPRFPYVGNSRGVGLADMVDALERGRAPRADASLAFHVLEVMEGLLESSARGLYLEPTSTFSRPPALPRDAHEYRFRD